MKLALQIVMWLSLLAGTVVLATAFSRIPAYLSAGAILAFSVAALCWVALGDWKGGGE